jgi:hypothetical protein
MRTLSPTAIATLKSSYIRLGIFAELHFRSSIEYVWSGLGSISWNGQTWLGLGELGGISGVTEATDLTAQGITITLSGIRPALLTEVKDQVQLGLPAKIYLVLMDANVVPVDSISCYVGRMDQPSIVEGTDSDIISISVENRLSDLQRAQFRRLTDQDQRREFPNDDGFKFVTQLQDWVGSWGSGTNGF